MDLYETFVRRGWPERVAHIYSGWKAPPRPVKKVKLYIYDNGFRAGVVFTGNK